MMNVRAKQDLSVFMCFTKGLTISKDEHASRDDELEGEDDDD
jgi:hypothetical protein